MDDQRADRDGGNRRLIRVLLWLAAIGWLLQASVYLKDGNPRRLIAGVIGFLIALAFIVLFELRWAVKK
jgi:hypothetical protein